MLDPDLKVKALRALQHPPRPSVEWEERIFAHMTAESLKLEGIETSADEILKLVRSHEKKSSNTVGHSS